MKVRKNAFLILLAFLLALSLAACGQNTEKAVSGNDIEKSAEPMETSAPQSTDNDSMGTETEDATMDNGDSDEDATEDEDSDNNDTTESDDEMTTDTDRIFTLEELSKYNGRDGNPAYVAVDGIVYDLTDSGAWRNGKHNGFTAGKDLTEEIKNISPHGVKNLEGIPIVGKLAEE